MAADTLPVPDDVILQILAQVPDAPSILRFAATCKRWRALVADPSFLRRRWPNPAYSFLDSFAPKKLDRGRGDEGPTPRSALAAGHRMLCSLVPDATALPADSLWALTSHDGLLLLRLLNHSPEQTGGVPLAVCSLLAGTCDVLPPFERYIDSIGHAVVTSRQSSFKVLMIEDAENETDYVLHTFVAGQPSWNAPTKSGVRRAALGSLMHSDAVVCQGTANWLFCAPSIFHVLHVDAETGRFSSTKLTSPIDDSWADLDLYVQRDRSRLVTTTDGKLLSLCLYDAGLELVEIWTQPEPAARQQADWTRTGVIHLKQVLEQPQQRQVPYIWLGGTCGNGKLLITLAHRHGYIANLQTGTMQEVDNLSCSGSITRDVICVEIDWTTFFMARLACKNQRAG